jgi:hypothetical protein
VSTVSTINAGIRYAEKAAPCTVARDVTEDTLETISGNTYRDEFFFFAYRHRGDHTAVPLIHDVILRTGYLGHYEISRSCKTKFGTPFY